MQIHPNLALMNTWPQHINDPLWARISAYEIDTAGVAFPFSAKLAKEQNWSTAFTARATNEYKRFIYLCCKFPQGASPSPAVDEVWHLHLTYTVDYWQRFCKQTLGQEIHHNPSAGGTTEREKYSTLYADTLNLYTQTFGEAPPRDIWPAPAPVVSRAPTEPPPLPLQQAEYNFFEAGPKSRYLLLVIPFAFGAMFYGQPIPFALTGAQFLMFYLVLCLCVLIATNISLKAKEQKLKELPGLLFVGMTKYDLAYIAGGGNRMLAMCITDLIQSGCLVYAGNDTYTINTAMRSMNGNPLYPYLEMEDQAAPISLNKLGLRLQDITREKAARYDPFIKSYNASTNNILLPLLLVAIGLARVIQGISNDRPVGFLVAIVLVMTIVFVFIKSNNNIYKLIQKQLHAQPEYIAHLDDNTSRSLLLYGIAGGIALHGLSSAYMYDTVWRNAPAANNNRPGDNSWSSCTSSCSGGSDSSSDSGSSCSSGGDSGCGGCGGGGD